MSDDAAWAEPEELWELLWALRDDSLDEAQWARLEELLRQDPAARRLYLQMTHIFAALNWTMTTTRSTAARPEAAATIALHAPPQRPHSPTRFVSRAAATAGFALIFYGLMYLFIDNLRGNSPDREQVGAAEPARFVGVLTGSDQARWRVVLAGAPGAPGALGTPQVGDELRRGANYELMEGAVELQLVSGAQLILEAPALFRLDSAKVVSLDAGKLVARVPPRGRGYVVETPQLKLIDRGTEFGVNVRSADVTDVQVFIGQVEVTPRSAESAPPSPALQLRAGDFARAAGEASQPVSLRRIESSEVRAMQPRFRRAVAAPQLKCLEQGAGFLPDNLARERGAAAFARDWLDGAEIDAIYPQHRIEHLNDGRYGNTASWIGRSLSPAFAGIRFAGPRWIGSIAFGRDNGGEERAPKEVFDDMWQGTYHFQYTTAADPDENLADEQWVTFGQVKYDADDPLIGSRYLTPWLRHRYVFPPIKATGVRIIVPGPYRSASPTCIDEIEVYAPQAAAQP